MQVRRVVFEKYADYVRPGIEAIGAQCGRPTLYEEVQGDCEAGRAFLFITDDGGFFVLLPFVRDSETVVRVQAAVSKGARSMERYQPLIEAMARDIGGTALEFWTARDGFERAAPRLGWRKAFTIWSMNL